MSEAIQNALVALLKTLPELKDTYTASTLSFDAASHKILDSEDGLGFLETGDIITISGSTSNDGSYSVSNAADGEITINEDLINEAAGEEITLVSPVHVTRANYDVLDSEVDKSIVVLPGSFTSTDAAGGTLTRIWSIPFDLFIKYVSDPETNATLTTFRDKLISLLDSYPTLNGQPNITLDTLSAPDDIDEVRDRQGGGPYFLMQNFRLEITERVALTEGEYA
jgi:hypothetical protein